MSKKLIVIFILFFCVGCGQSFPFSQVQIKDADGDVRSETDESELAAVVNIMQAETDIYQLYNRIDDYHLSLYEPEEGCYLGTYILSNKKINFDMGEFERLVGKEHSMFMYNVRLGDPFPTNWLLSCIAQMKTPYIVIMPPNEYRPFDEDLLLQTAQQFGEFYIPIFVDFYPIAGRNQYEAEAYKAFYQKARMIFAEYASNVAFVWSVSREDIFHAKTYYPGDHTVDWVGLSFYQSIEQRENNGMDDDIYGTDIFSELNYFYYTFQSKKPLIISQLAISHYAGIDHVYRTKEASAEITKIYNAIIQDYPRIKAVIYMDFNGIGRSPVKAGGDDFSITDENTVKEAYSSVIKHENFLSRLDVASSGDQSSQLIRSPFPALKWRDKLFVSEKSLIYDLGIHDLSAYQSKIIDGQLYVDLFEVEEVKKSKVDEERKKIIFSRSTP